MTEFKILAEGEKIPDPENYLKIEMAQIETAEQPSGKPGYRVIGEGFHNHFQETYENLEEAREMALHLAKTWSLSTVYLTEEVAHVWQ